MFKSKIVFLFTFLLFITMSACKTQEKNINTSTQNTPVLFVRMEKTPCYGPCPSYVLEIYDNGTTTFNGKSFVEFLGTHQSTISKENLDVLKSKIIEINFFELDSTYDSPATDIPSCIIQVSLDNKSKKIIDRRYGPKELKDLEKLIEDKVLKSNLIKSEQ